MSPSQLWHFFPVGYLFTISIETPILLVGLSPQHSWRRRLLAGIWLTGCTYPIVILVLSQLFTDRRIYLLVAETFAPVAECLLFWMAFGNRDSGWKMAIRDFSVITLANLASFTVGELLNYWNWFGLLS
ncbi:MAG TPA: hypothetical protein VLB68_18230 [Pyrinomonadaceae bacterium]|nr:hypothetical protein [Pyrinomonadaceae bacterium]